RPVAASSAPLPGASPRPADDIPELEPLPESASRALAPVNAQQTAPWWKVWSSNAATPKATDEPYWPDVLRACGQLNSLRNQLTYVHANLNNAAWLVTLPQASDVFTAPDVLRASLVASLSGRKHRLDVAAASGATATTFGHSRREFTRIVVELRAMDAERRPLEKTASERHASIKAAADKSAREAEEAAHKSAREAEELAHAATRKLEEIRGLSPDERDKLVERIEAVSALGFGFARCCHTAPGWKENADHEALPANMVIPTLGLRGAVDFNARFPNNTVYLQFGGWKRLTSRAELEDVLDTILGRGPDRSRE
ncbi:MAG: hypothetical protein ACAI38_23845, partial [Myxococcota bacterium]